MTKLEKIDKELEKSREKAAEWQAKIKDLERLHDILSLSTESETYNSFPKDTILSEESFDKQEQWAFIENDQG